MKGIGEWLASGHVGLSSQVLAAATLGVVRNTAPSYPHDVGDFGRCRYLYLRTPEAKEGLAMLAAISGPWHRLALRWDELLSLYDTDRDACHKLIRKLIGEHYGRCEIRKGDDGRWDTFQMTRSDQ